MLLVIPEIIIKDKKCYHRIGGIGEDLSLKFMHDPVQMAKLLRRENAKCLHITDLDSLSGGVGNLPTILNLESNVDIPIQVMGFWQDEDIWISLLDNGIYRVIIPSSQVVDTGLFGYLRDMFDASRIVALIEICGEHKRDEFDKLLKDLEKIGIQRIVIGEFGDINIELGGRFRKYLSHLHEFNFKVTIYNMIKTVPELFNLSINEHKVYDSFVVGRPLYENVFPCQLIWRVIESKLE